MKYGVDSSKSMIAIFIVYNYCLPVRPMCKWHRHRSRIYIVVMHTIKNIIYDSHRQLFNYVGDGDLTNKLRARVWNKFIQLLCKSRLQLLGENARRRGTTVVHE